jgi:hypothetical protein
LYSFCNNVKEVGIESTVAGPETYAKKPFIEITDDEINKILKFINKTDSNKLIVSVMGDRDTLRKTFITTSVRVAGLTGSKSVTKHKHTTTTDRHYNKSTAFEAKEYARQVAKVLQFKKVV